MFIATWWWKALWNKHSLLVFRLISCVGNFKSFSMLVTEPGSLLYWCLMKWADLLCTISIFFNIIFLIWIPGTTCVFNIGSCYRLICSFLYFFWEFADTVFLLKKPSDLFALANMVLICVSHLSVLVNWTPKYGFWSTFSNTWSCMV